MLFCTQDKRLHVSMQKEEVPCCRTGRINGDIISLSQLLSLLSI